MLPPYVKFWDREKYELIAERISIYDKVGFYSYYLDKKKEKVIAVYFYYNNGTAVVAFTYRNVEDLFKAFAATPPGSSLVKLGRFINH